MFKLGLAPYGVEVRAEVNEIAAARLKWPYTRPVYCTTDHQAVLDSIKLTTLSDQEQVRARRDMDVKLFDLHHEWEVKEHEKPLVGEYT